MFGVQVLEGYIAPMQPTEDEEVVLFQDDGPGHKALENLELALKNHIHIFPGMPNLTHLWQMMDKLFALWKQRTNKLVEDMPNAHAVTVHDVGYLLRGKEITGAGGPLFYAFSKEKIASAWDQVAFPQP